MELHDHHQDPTVSLSTQEDLFTASYSLLQPTDEKIKTRIYNRPPTHADRSHIDHSTVKSSQKPPHYIQNPTLTINEMSPPLNLILKQSMMHAIHQRPRQQRRTFSNKWSDSTTMYHHPIPDPATTLRKLQIPPPLASGPNSSSAPTVTQMGPPTLQILSLQLPIHQYSTINIRSFRECQIHSTNGLTYFLDSHR